MRPNPADKPLAVRLGQALLWLLILLLALLLWSTIARETYGGAPKVDQVGTASVVECTKHGPIGIYGFGTSYGCVADVRWADGDTERRDFHPGQLSPADIGQAVPVYLDLGGYREPSYVGRNDTARFAALSFPAVLAGGLGSLIIALTAVAKIFRVFQPKSADPGRPDPPRRPTTRPLAYQAAGQRLAKKWPLASGDRERAGLPRITLRAWLLAAWCVLAIVLVLVSTIPRFDAPRAPEFVSPWPQIGQALLVDLTPLAVVILGLILAVVLSFVAFTSRQEAARVVRYGIEYLADRSSNNGKGGRKKATNEEAFLQPLAERKSAQRRNALIVGAVLVALTGWALVRFLQAIPASAPGLVWFAGATDVILLALLSGIWLGTIQTRYDRLHGLLQRHPSVSG